VLSLLGNPAFEGSCFFEGSRPVGNIDQEDKGVDAYRAVQLAYFRIFKAERCSFIFCTLRLNYYKIEEVSQIGQGHKSKDIPFGPAQNFSFILEESA
jgi:hypothetical protein